MIKLAKLARKDLLDIHDYIAKDSIYYAKEVTQSLLLAIRNLEVFPEMGRVVPEFREPKIREIILGSYRIIYRIREDIEIAAFIHIKRDLEKTIRERINDHPSEH
ncbi:MAG: type II toxin-antitoxin system RelE/ParE family toxin [Spirochaetes bacterium]|jgi:toxin ParE1/3/4|nr:type II toxin-antitoxin system RelE/ParE family toxin [Spirochaetota bacterium]